MKFDEDKLKKEFEVIFKSKKELQDTIPTINLNSPANVDNDNLIHIFQHPFGMPIRSSSSDCRIIGTYVCTYVCTCTYLCM